MSFDKIVSRQFNDKVIEYGIVLGNSPFVILKAGQGGNIYGYQNKYYEMAKELNHEFGCTVITSSNPYDGTDSLCDAVQLVNEIALEKEVNDIDIYYFGTSNGGRIGIQWGAQYPQISKFVLVNTPLMINWHKLKNGLTALQKNKNQQVTLVYGLKDPSASYIGLLNGYETDNIHLLTFQEMGHNFSEDINLFKSLPRLLMFDNCENLQKGYDNISNQ